MYGKLCWIVIVCCWQETQVQASLSMLSNRTRVALAGEKLKFSLTVVVPANTTASLHCICQKSSRSIWHKNLKSEFTETKLPVTAEITMHNSSSSGKYLFRYIKWDVHWVVEVRDKGYEEPPDELDNATITMMALTGILLVFSVTASIYILKSYKRQRPCKDDRNEVAEQSPEENYNLDEDAGSASLYTALQCKSDSIYDTLHQDTVVNEENTQKTNSYLKYCKAQENEAFDSIYENLQIN